MPPRALGNSWVVGQGLTGPGGKPLSRQAANNLMQQAPASVQNAPNSNAFQAWLSQHQLHAVVGPISRRAGSGTSKLIEGGWLLALSLVLIAATVWVVRRRAA